MEIGRAFGDPFEELPKPRMAAQRFGRVVDAGQLGLGQGGVDLVMANLVDQHGRPALAAAQFRHKVVQALRCVRRNRAVAERANGSGIHGG